MVMAMEDHGMGMDGLDVIDTPRGLETCIRSNDTLLNLRYSSRILSLSISFYGYNLMEAPQVT